MEINWTNILILIFSFVTLVITLIQYLQKSKQNSYLPEQISLETKPQIDTHITNTHTIFQDTIVPTDNYVTSQDTIIPTDIPSELQDIPVALFKSKSNGEIYFTNAYYDLVTGINDNTRHETWVNLLNSEDFEKINTERTRLLSEGQKFEAKVRIKRKQGEFTWVQIFELPAKDNKGKVQYYVGSIVNIQNEVRNKELTERFQTGLDQLQLLTITDARGLITYANDSFCKVSKYPAEEIVGQQHSIINSGYHRRSFFKNLWTTINAGEVWKGELCNKSKTGSTFWLRTTIMPLTDPLGIPTQFIALSHDVSSQKLWEKQVLEAKANAESLSQQLTAIVSVAPDGIIVTNREGRIVEFNPAAEKMFGYAKNDVLARNITETIIPPQFKNNHKEGLEHFLNTGKEKIINTVVEISAYKKSKKEFPVELLITSFDYDGESFFAAYIKDISLRKEAQKALEETYAKIEFENKIWRVIDRVNVNLLAMQDENDILGILLQILCEDLGWNIAQVFLKKTSNNISNMSYKHSYTLDSSKYAKFVETSKETSFKIGCGIPGRVWETKSPYWVLDISEKQDYPRRNIAVSEGIQTCLGIPIFVNNDIYGVLEVFSEQKQPEDPSLIRGMMVIASSFSKVIEHQLQQKIEDDYREQLTRNAKLSSMGEMASGIAHEINNPLTVIKGHAKVILKILNSGEFDPEKLRHSTQKINDTLDRIVKIIKGLQNISRDGSAGDPFHLTLAKQIIEDTVSLCEAKVKNAGIDFTIVPYSESLTFECRSYQISQILINLVNNSVDAIEKYDERWIEVEVQDSEEFIEIFVTDSGKGIPDDVADKISQAFFTTKEFGKGTGLGLSITKAIIESHHGEFGLVRNYKNTRFFIKLPKKQLIINEHINTGFSTGNNGPRSAA